METEPYVLGIEELGQLLHDQENIGKILHDKGKDSMDTFILEEVLGQDNIQVEVQKQDPEEEKRKSKQVCLFFYWERNVIYTITVIIRE